MSYKQQEIRELWVSIDEQLHEMKTDSAEGNKENLKKRLNILKDTIKEIEQIEEELV